MLVFAHHQAVLDELQAGLGRVPFIRIDGGVSSRCSTTTLPRSGRCCSQAAGSSAGLRIRRHVGLTLGETGHAHVHLPCPTGNHLHAQIRPCSSALHLLSAVAASLRLVQVTNERRKEAVDRFQRDAHIRAALLSITAAGVRRFACGRLC